MISMAKTKQEKKKKEKKKVGITSTRCNEHIEIYKTYLCTKKGCFKKFKEPKTKYWFMTT